MNLSVDTLNLFWGKADRKNPKRTLAAIYHMLDVAVVAQAIFDTLPWVEKDLVLKPFRKSKNPESVLFWLIALHDIGKLTPGFQYKLDEEYLAFDTIIFPNKSGAEPFHGQSGFMILCQVFMDCLDISKASAKALATSVASHHGRFEWNFNASRKKQGRYGKESWQALQSTAIEWMFQQFDLTWVDIKIEEEHLSVDWLVYMAGLCAVADWIGSDERKFSYGVTNYDAVKLERKIKARETIKQLGLKSLALANSTFDFDLAFGFKPNALQRQCLSLGADSSLSSINIIEAPMGVGKTEAALTLAHRLAVSNGCNGIYVAMPSQASSNQLFDRVNSWLGKLNGLDQTVETHLLHSNAELNTSYQQIQTASVNGYGGRDNIVASQWFLGRKRGLLATCAVGTIDQLLMSSMLVKHNFVRLFALTNKVVVLDEVHAVDAFQLALLCNLLGWLAKLGSPVILLSATLPDFMREKLFEAYLGKSVNMCTAVPYPRLSSIKNDEVVAVHVGESTVQSLQYYFTPIYCKQAETVFRMAANVVDDMAIAKGGVTVCIVNTVKAAQQLFKLIKQRLAESEEITVDVETILFHARFPLFQRLEIEVKIKGCLGANKEDRTLPNPKRFKRCIVVGTQVLEQSLDYSGDSLHSELAPMDLLLQRAGRLHRHAINKQVMPNHFLKATCRVYLPDTLSGVSENPEDTFGYANAKIYPPSILLKTAHCFDGKNSLLKVNLPNDIDTLVQKVYGNGSDMHDMDNDWQLLDNYERKQQVVIAKSMLFNSNGDVIEELIDSVQVFKEDDLSITTRLALPSITLVLFLPSKKGWLTACDNQLVEFVDGKDMDVIRRFKQSSVNITAVKWVQHFGENYTCQFWQQNTYKTLWKNASHLYGCVPVCLDENLSYTANELGCLIWSRELGVCI